MPFQPIPCPPSSNIAQVLYDQDKQDLLILFQRQGRRYIYHQVPVPVAQGFSQCASTGEYFLLSIKDQYPYEPI